MPYPTKEQKVNLHLKGSIDIDDGGEPLQINYKLYPQIIKNKFQNKLEGHVELIMKDDYLKNHVVVFPVVSGKAAGSLKTKIMTDTISGKKGFRAYAKDIGTCFSDNPVNGILNVGTTTKTKKPYINIALLPANQDANKNPITPKDFGSMVKRLDKKQGEFLVSGFLHPSMDNPDLINTEKGQAEFSRTALYLNTILDGALEMSMSLAEKIAERKDVINNSSRQKVSLSNG